MGERVIIFVEDMLRYFCTSSDHTHKKYSQSNLSNWVKELYPTPKQYHIQFKIVFHKQ